MATREAVEAVVVVISLGGFISYHVWLFLFRGRGSKVSKHFAALPAGGLVVLPDGAVDCCTSQTTGARCPVMLIGGSKSASKPSLVLHMQVKKQYHDYFQVCCSPWLVAGHVEADACRPGFRHILTLPVVP